MASLAELGDIKKGKILKKVLNDKKQLKMRTSVVNSSQTDSPRARFSAEP